MFTSQRHKVSIIYLMAFLGSFGVPLTVPLLPFIMSEFSLSNAQLGLMVSCYALPGIVMIPFCGVMADRIGRKQLLLPGVFLCIISSFGCSQAETYNQLIMWRILQGLAVTPIEVLSNSIITDMFKGEERVTYLGRNISAIYVGLAFFPVLSSIMLGLFGWRSAFLLPVFIGIPALILLFKVDLPFVRGTASLKSYLTDVRKAMFTAQALRLFGMQMLLVMIIFGVVILHLPLLITDKLGASPHTVGFIFAFSSLVQVISSANIGKLSRRYPQRWLGLIAASFMGLACLGLLTMPMVWLLLVPMTFYGLSLGSQSGLIIVNVVSLAPEHARATVLSVNALVFRIAQLFAPTLCALLYQHGSFLWLFGFGIAVSVGLGALAFTSLGLQTSHPNTHP